ncbi:MAG: CBS domain-containing protein [Saprospiraceae bacterium]|nr:CBS domain-containing protein [Saprospiraceae bacterium]
MGSEKIVMVGTKAVRQRCMQQLLTDLKALELMLERDLFERDIQRIGAEQELCFVDQSWRPAPVITEVLPELPDPHFTTEYARFNMEINLDPMLFSGDCLSQLEGKLRYYLGEAEAVARKHNAHVLLVGILPTLRRSDVELENMTPLPRYRLITEIMTKMRGSPFEFRIEGTDQLITKDANVLFEGSNTSFQVHYQVDPDDFVPAYNWAQAVTAPLMASATNSPMLVGKRLWRETRIALFQQSVDTRNTAELIRERCPRVSFGTGWVQQSILDIYRSQLARHRLLLGPSTTEDALKVLEGGGIPKLYALNIFNGTIYKWNRACYGITDGKPHLRIENRVLPAGPTIVDEVANAAFWLGMMKGRPEEYDRISERLDFDHAKGNFLRAAHQGMGAHFRWPGLNKQIASPELILKEMLPIAREGLQKARIETADIDRYLGIIQERVETGKTGSQWILDSYQDLKKLHSKDEAQVATVAGIYHRQQQGDPVHTWNLAGIEEAGSWANRYGMIDQIMSTDLFTVNEDDLVDFVAHIMEWRKIRHLPVENDRGELVGILTAKDLVRYYSNRYCRENKKKRSVKELVSTRAFSVSPDTSTIEALALMRRAGLDCLAVVDGKHLMGIVTEHDFVMVAEQLLKEVGRGLSPIDQAGAHSAKTGSVRKRTGGRKKT